MEQVKRLIAEVLNEAADVIATGRALKNIRVGITLLGSEHGVLEVLKGAEMAAQNLPNVEVVVIGPEDVETRLTKVVVTDEKEGHRVMEKMLDSGELNAAVTMHYNFPIGTSTVGLVVTPAQGRKMFIATTTGTSSPDRVEGMVKNAIYGIAAAKAYGIKNPKVGILNVDGARQVERILKELQSRGYPIDFSESKRSDGGVVMRGNDLLAGTPDVMICDSLTGNLLIKIFSAYTTGGSYEALGYGYGPGIGEGFNKIINIISRASGAPVIAGAIEYAAAMAQGRLVEVAQAEIAAAKNAGLLELVKPLEKKETVEEVKMPPKKPVDKEIAGIDVLELENAQKLLWKHGIYAETGMGCTGPIILVAPDDLSQALKVLKENKVL
ncbi:glycine/sarcosine/betaine reductase complex component C subunit alpha [Carboxydothermus hydrogenoformans]|uniref:Glycine reductase complex, protein D n=1 Tax=Carboxydothermus hydrogenoformans (strain ATCC BAA-161 / DSM 6008 / Z-2901) TaxID=246194 RepID=Q3A9J2_CARHZ|nr:glycine/sarcosine/betaine reductase complex component C subunit alpha [Carboxydothermus hydrogenoformans]ABB14663.1 glycine reductase complex, protein D [Carboxydothermus hydrogenoformans Z-2901]